VLRSGRAGDRAYRVGGDEFVVLLPHADADGVQILGQRLCRAMSDAGIKASIGVSALRPGQRADDLRAEADAALYEAKRRGGNQVAHFDDIRDHITVTTSETSAAVRRMIGERGIATVFQPIWNLAEGSLLGVEALTRPNAEYGLSGPLEAFDIAQQIGRVHELDAACVTSALAIAPDLPPDVLLFLNICPQTLDLDGDHDDWILDAVRRAGLPTSRIVLEITERFGGRTASIVKSIEQLRRHGFKIALDDVGTGNSGLEMLRQINAEYVKLDRSIVAAAATDPTARAVLMAMATFARQTGAYVIAEGIEDQDTLAFLHTIDRHDNRPKTIIQGGQGYELGRPSPWSPTAPPPHLQTLTDHQYPPIAATQ
jgi:EAL domain-containing protein (putative c-di-GMP-specific phosphodiesterase class I)